MAKTEIDEFADKAKQLKEKTIRKISESKKKIDDSGVVEKTKTGIGKTFGKLRQKVDSKLSNE